MTPQYLGMVSRINFGPYDKFTAGTILTENPRYLKYTQMSGRIIITNNKLIGYLEQVSMGTNIKTIEIDDVLKIDLDKRHTYLVYNKSGQDDMLSHLVSTTSAEFNSQRLEYYKRGELCISCLDFRDKNKWYPDVSRATAMCEQDEVFSGLAISLLKDYGIQDLIRIKRNTVDTMDGREIFIPDLDRNTQGFLALLFNIYFADVVIVYEASKNIKIPVLRGLRMENSEIITGLGKIILIETEQIGYLTTEQPADMLIKVIPSDSEVPLLYYDTLSAFMD